MIQHLGRMQVPSFRSSQANSMKMMMRSMSHADWFVSVAVAVVDVVEEIALQFERHFEAGLGECPMLSMLQNPVRNWTSRFQFQEY